MTDYENEVTFTAARPGCGQDVIWRASPHYSAKMHSITYRIPCPSCDREKAAA